MRRALLFSSLITLSCFSERTAGPRDNAGGQLCASTPGPNIVQIRNYAFHPAELSVSSGTAVTWVNCDQDVHTSTGTGSATWSSGLLSPNSTFTRRFDDAGRFTYRCDPHPFMTAAVVVR